MIMLYDERLIHGFRKTSLKVLQMNFVQATRTAGRRKSRQEGVNGRLMHLGEDDEALGYLNFRGPF